MKFNLFQTILNYFKPKKLWKVGTKVALELEYKEKETSTKNYATFPLQDRKFHEAMDWYQLFFKNTRGRAQFLMDNVQLIKDAAEPIKRFKVVKKK